MTAGARTGTSPVTVPDDERLVRAMLLRAVEPGTLPVLMLATQAGVRDTLDTILRGFPIGQADVEGMQGRLWPGCAEQDLEAAARCGARLVIPSDPDWPAGMRDLDRVRLGSFGLYVRGEVADIGACVDRSVAIVGTRAATAYGVDVASGLAAGLAGAGWTVVSGLAYGVDGAAHRGALGAPAGSAGTVAVLACGVDQAYPRRHGTLLHAILTSGGAVISEHPPDSAPFRTRFLIRNRLIAALSRGTVVVEAAARSGARTTARYAGGLGRAVMAVPGPVSSHESVGCHQLLRDDPTVGLVTCVADVIEMVGEIGDLAPRPQGPVAARDRLCPVDGRVLDAVPVKQPAEVASIAVAAGVAVPRAVAVLESLALAGFVVARDGGWVLSPAAAEDRRTRARGQDPLELDWW